jgi:hypothetical protein
VVKVAFSLAFARDGQAPDAAFFTSQQHHPENFWNPAFQVHANTAERIASIVLVAENPTDHHIFLSAFVGERELMATSSGVTIHTPRGDIVVMDPAAFNGHFGVEPPDTADGARLAAIVFRVREFATTVSALQKAGIKGSVRMGRIVVGSDEALGAAIVFEQG